VNSSTPDVVEKSKPDIVNKPRPRRTEKKTVCGDVFGAHVESVGNKHDYVQHSRNRKR
jgi:hypothetical protein